MKKAFKIVTNNPLVKETLENEYHIEFVECSYEEILRKVRNYIYEGYELLTHPLSGSVKPNETPYKSIMVSEKKEKLDEIIEVLPGMKSPTITPLANDEWVSVQSVIAEKHFWEIIGKLKSLGAEGILVLPIEKMIV